MDLLDKVRTLLGALVHKPFTRSVDRQPGGSQDMPPGSAAAKAQPQKESTQTPAVETERVADLIADQSREG